MYKRQLDDLAVGVAVIIVQAAAGNHKLGLHLPQQCLGVGCGRPMVPGLEHGGPQAERILLRQGDFLVALGIAGIQKGKVPGFKPQAERHIICCIVTAHCIGIHTGQQHGQCAGADGVLLAGIGSFIAPFFAPLGFGDWRAATALVTGLTAKEVVISTLSVLMGGDGDIPGTALQSIFTPLTALSFLTFSLLYPPCIAALAAIRREMNSTVETFYIMSYQIITSWIVAFIVYNLGKILGFK